MTKSAAAAAGRPARSRMVPDGLRGAVLVLSMPCLVVATLQLTHQTAPMVRDPASAGSIVCFGDSWAAFACDTLASVVALNGKPNKVINKGVAGSTATFWANDTDLMLATLLSSGLPEFVWLSIGGDDILDGYATHACDASSRATQAACNALIFNATDKMLSAMLGAVPWLQIVHFGYDFTNFVYSDECIALAAAEFGVNGTQPDINDIFLNWATDVLQPLSAKYPVLSYAYPPLWGTLQSAGGPALTPPPYPNAAYPSPEEFMNDGCIHASKAGWGVLMEALYEAYFKARL